MNTDELFGDFLGELERTEAKLLGWGLVEGFFTHDELKNRAEDFLERAEDGWSVFSSATEIIDALEDRGLIFSWVFAGTEKRYRTRMAESVRLVAGLKQLFPKHLKAPGDWLTASSLVSDFRFINRPRQSPKRDQNPARWIPQWIGDPYELTPLQRQVMEAMLSDGQGGFFPLAGFQVRSTTRILQEVRAGIPSATIVCAGTGSGKTLAFYLPALTHLAGLIEKDASKWVRALAIYPRNELLKDQISETLFQLSRINPALRAKGVRPLRVGTLFGPTPKNTWRVAEEWKLLPDNSRICPFLACPSPGCDSPLVWKRDDIQAKIERVSCPKCGHQVREDEIVLTRDGLSGGTPDLLFTTTEMMNQRMSDSQMWNLFGVGMAAERKPAFLLLDEAHTYNGLHGAQVAYLLRRWLKRSGAKPHIVGLSATLMEAVSFFAGLAGIPASNVEEISPESEEMKPSGMEYLLAVRGDPVSGASLLSTTIQTAMLMRRVLDTTDSPTSNGFFGKKLFVFTDDLDATNRLYFNLLDAEGQNSWGKLDPARHPTGSLANLRSPNQLQAPGVDGLSTQEDKRFEFGQSWRLAHSIGHEFHQSVRMPVGRVSSQDSGVSEESEVVVATASLEVGFNDPGVGAVIQHKAPRDPASFLQRKGRAGRRMKMRPWTIVVLSDFGRDRLAYQGYDLLFDPELRPRELPLDNRHVLKMQAVFAMMDWLGIHLGQGPRGSVWESIDIPVSASYSTVPPERRDKMRKDRQQRQVALWEKVGKVLEGGEEFQQLTVWIKGTLGVGDDQVNTLLWDPPRALMTSVIPTLKRRLEYQWEDGREFYQFWKPLPEFVPATLFSGLNLPEVGLETFSSKKHANSGSPKVESMGIDQALREFAPGRISKRFGVEYGGLRHWIAIDPDGGNEQHIELSRFIPDGREENVGDFSYFDEAGILRKIRTVRPYTIRACHEAPKKVRDSSNALPIWHSQLLEPNDPKAGLVIDLPSRSQWTGVIHEIRFFIHSQFSPARIRRFTRGSHASLNFDDGSVCEIESRFVTNKTDPVALGFAFEADAVRVRVLPPQDWKLGSGESEFAEKVPALRAARYRWLVRNDESLKKACNVFGRERIAEVSLSAVIANAALNGWTPEEAWQSIRSGESEIGFDNALDVLFQAIADEEGPGKWGGEPKRLKELREFLDSKEIIYRLDSLVPVLWKPIDEEEWRPWLTERFLATLGASFRDAIQQMCPSIDADSLLIDIAPGPRDDGSAGNDEGYYNIWITEAEPGGGGVIEKFLPEVAESPRRFLELVRSALGPGDFEQADRELRRFLELLCAPKQRSPDLIDAVSKVRDAQSLEERVRSFEALRTLMSRVGFVTSHVVVAAINSRLLKAGSNPATDELCWKISHRWQEAEQKIGIEVDARSFAYAQSEKDELDQALSSQSLPLSKQQDKRNWRFNSLYGLLWPRGAQARNQALTLRNPYAEIPDTERFLALDALNRSEPPVDFLTKGWRTRFREILINNGRGHLACVPDRLSEFKTELLSLLVHPLDTGSLLVYPRLRGIERDLERWVVDFEIIVPGNGSLTGDVDEPDGAKSRLIVRSAEGNREEVRDLLESILAIEILSPGKKLWLVSPWITDVPVLDNRSGSYGGLDAAWPKRRLSLAELLASLLTRCPDTLISVVTRPNGYPATERFQERLKTILDLNGNLERLSFDDSREVLHIKGLIGDHSALSGSMNFTNNGINVLEESVQLQIDDYTVSEFLKSFEDQYGSA